MRTRVGGSAGPSTETRTAAGVRTRCRSCGEWRVEIASFDGRFLSSEVTESFTGRVVGVYAVEGTVRVRTWIAEGDDE